MAVYYGNSTDWDCPQVRVSTPAAAGCSGVTIQQLLPPTPCTNALGRRAARLACLHAWSCAVHAGPAHARCDEVADGVGAHGREGCEPQGNLEGPQVGRGGWALGEGMDVGMGWGRRFRHSVFKIAGCGRRQLDWVGSPPFPPCPA